MAQRQNVKFGGRVAEADYVAGGTFQFEELLLLVLPLYFGYLPQK